MTIFLWIIVFIAGIAVLVKATDHFVEAAEKIGLHFNIEPFIIGVFILGLGTSLPELVVSLIAVFQDTTGVIIGNVLGSNITNVFLVLGISAIIVKESTIRYNFLAFDLPLFITSAFFLTIAIWNGSFGLFEGIFFLAIFVVYIIYSITSHKKNKPIIPEKVKKLVKEKVNVKTILKIIISPIFIYLGAKYTVEAVINLSANLDIGAEIIAASAIALGTSLPELSVSFVTIKKGKIDEMLGNIIGSNILNILFVMGVPAIIKTIIIPQSMLSFALPFMLVATIVFFIVIYDKKITRGEGIVLLMFYAFYILKLYDLI